MSQILKLSAIFILLSTISCFQLDSARGDNVTTSRPVAPPKYLGKVGRKAFLQHNDCTPNKNWHEAKELCKSLGSEMVLATIESKNEATFLANNLDYENWHYWTAARSVATFVWDTEGEDINVEELGVKLDKDQGTSCGSVYVKSKELYFQGRSCNLVGQCGVLCHSLNYNDTETSTEK